MCADLVPAVAINLGHCRSVQTWSLLWRLTWSLLWQLTWSLLMCADLVTADVCRRVELVLLHGPDAEPQGTAAWLEARPHLARHHHIRLTHPKVHCLFLLLMYHARMGCSAL